tara:strand:- start:242 stop:550 length:309 start_codon:yes stop_codon:yes gene_type:complete
MKMPQRKVLNVTQQQIDDAHSKAEEHYSRSSSMTRTEYNSMVAKDIMESEGGKYDTIEKVEYVVKYCEESGDDIRAKAIKQWIRVSNPMRCVNHLLIDKRVE